MYCPLYLHGSISITCKLKETPVKLCSPVFDQMCSNGFRWFCDLETDEDDEEEEDVVAEELDLLVDVSMGSVDRRDQPVVQSDSIM